MERKEETIFPIISDESRATYNNVDAIIMKCKSGGGGIVC
jgi:hypothetical protein